MDVLFSMTGKRWSAEENRLIKRMYPTHTHRECANEIKQRFGINRSPAAVKAQAIKLFISKKRPTGLFTISAAIAFAGCNKPAVLRLIAQGKIKAKLFNGQWFMTEHQVKKLEKIYNPIIKWDCLSTKEAADMIGYNGPAAINFIASRRHIDSFKVGYYTFVRKDQILWGLEFMRRNECKNIPWHTCKRRMKLKGDQRYEASRFYDYQRRKRRKNRKPA